MQQWQKRYYKQTTCLFSRFQMQSSRNVLQKEKKMVWIFSRKFKWKYLCQGLFFNEAAACNGTQTHKHIVYRRTKVAGCRTTNLSKRDPDDRGVFLWNLPSDWFRFLHTRPASLPVENTKATPTLHTHKVLSEIQ